MQQVETCDLHFSTAQQTTVCLGSGFVMFLKGNWISLASSFLAMKQQRFCMFSTDCDEFTVQPTGFQLAARPATIHFAGTCLPQIHTCMSDETHAKRSVAELLLHGDDPVFARLHAIARTSSVIHSIHFFVFLSLQSAPAGSCSVVALFPPLFSICLRILYRLSSTARRQTAAQNP